jgi:hypothetical protein
MLNLSCEQKTLSTKVVTDQWNNLAGLLRFFAKGATDYGIRWSNLLTADSGT